MSAPSPCPGCEGERTQVFAVEGLDCASEVALVEAALRGTAGVCSVRASALTGEATVVHRLGPRAIEAVLARAGFGAREARRGEAEAPRAAATLAAFALTGAGFLAGFVSARLAVAFYLPAVAIGGAQVARKGLLRARRGALDMNALMTVAVAGAMLIGEWGEAATTVALFSLAQLLEARSLERARRAIGALVRLAPERAVVRRAAGEERVPAAAVAVGETIVVSPGEAFPLDGIVQSGRSEADQSPLTGESIGVPKQPGSEVFAGSVNGPGTLVVRVTRASSETRLSRIIRRVEEAQSSRAPSQGFVERFAAVYTPLVVGLAVLVAALPPLLGGEAFEPWLYRALVLLVISCPCALVISTPVSIVSALTAASRRGLLVKGGAHLEQSGRVRAVAFDKTGTLTRGVPEVTDVLPWPGATREQVLAAAAAVESRAGHPLGRAVVSRAEQEGLRAAPADEVRVLAGLGAEGFVAGRLVVVGGHRLFEERSLCDHSRDEGLLALEAEGKTAVLVGILDPEPRVLGAIGIADGVRPEAEAAVLGLRAEGIEVVLLTGDNAATARAIAARLGIADARAELLPEDKVAAMAELQRRFGAVAMVGDGVNDAPALAAASVGIAMGGRGSDAALETADVALASDDLRRVPELVRLGRRARRVIAQNIALALLVKGAVLLLALAGLGSLWAAVAADMGASLLVIGNGMRLLRPPAAAVPSPGPARLRTA